MNRQELINQSEAYIRRLLKEHIPSQARVYLYGSRSRRDNRWNSDYDLWIDADIPRNVIAEMTDQLDESFVPFKVDIPRKMIICLRPWKTEIASATFTMQKRLTTSLRACPVMRLFCKHAGEMVDEL